MRPTGASACFAVALSAVGCSHDWDAFEPVGAASTAGPGGATSASGAGGASAASGSGASGGNPSATGGSAGGGGGAGPTVLWAKRFGDGANQEARRVGVDGDGNIYVAGSFSGSIDFGGRTLQSAGGRDVFLVKLSPEGDHIWSMGAGDPGEQLVYGMTVLPDGDVVVAGGFEGTLEGFVSAGGMDGFVARVDPNGALECGLVFGSAGSQFASSVAPAPGNGLYMSGMFTGELGFPDDADTTSQGEGDIVIAHLDTACAPQLVQTYGSVGGDAAWSLASDGTGVLAIGIDARASIAFGGQTVDTAGAGDALVVRTTDGVVDWVQRYGDATDQWAPHLAIASDGSVIGGGSFQGAMQSGNATLQSADGFDTYAIKLDADGGAVWAKVFGGPDNQFMHDSDVDPSGNVFLAGYAGGTIDFGAGPVGGGGGIDLFVTALAPNGDLLWSLVAGDSFDQRANGVAVDESGAVIVTGEMAGSADILGTLLQADGGSDVFVFKLAP